MSNDSREISGKALKSLIPQIAEPLHRYERERRTVSEPHPKLSFLNHYSHEIFSQDDLARIDVSQFFEDICLVTRRIEVNEQKSFAA